MIREFIKKIKTSRRWETAKSVWYRYSSDPLPVLGLAIVIFSLFMAIFAPFVTPYPNQAFLYINYEKGFQPPSLAHPFGTDRFGRDILTRCFFGFRYSLTMAGGILAIAAPPGVLLGILAAYYGGKARSVIMRAADVFIAVPSLVLALSICAILEPNVFNAMVAVTVLWWPWYTRLTFNQASSVKSEYYVTAAELTGAPSSHVMFKEILPNCMGPLLTKMTLDLGWVILIGSTLSFLGLGAQAPTPDLGTMAASGLVYMPMYWWISLFPAFMIAFLVLGFNLVGDGINRVFARGEVVR